MRFSTLYLTPLFLFCVVMSYGQNYAVQSTVQLLQPYSVYLSDYATDGNQKLRVILQQGDLSRPVYQLRLVMSVELNGRVIMRTSRFFNPAPITLDPGVPTVIAGAELAPYVDSRNIDFIGYSKEQYEKTKALPEGSYQITFTAYDYRRQDQQVSNAGSAFYYLAKNEPPLINYPACDSKLPIKTPQQIIFSWMPRNTSSPTSAQDTEYEFTLYETRPEGRNPNDVVLSSQPVFRLRTDYTQIIYGPAEPMLLDNMVYVWRVQAIDRSGKDAFRNNGYSEVCTFKYGGTDPNFDIGVVKGLNAIGETDERAKIWWEPGDFDAYRVYYKKPGDQWQWFFNEVTKTEFKIFDLEPDNEYEVRVQGKKDGYYSPFTEIIKFRTREKIVAQCGDPSVTPEVIGPLQQAYIGMTINMSGIKVTLTKIENLGGGWFKGYGKAVLRYLGATYDVKFDRLYIDENLEAGDGDVDVITRGMAAMATEQLTAQKEKQQEENRQEWAGTDFYEKIVSFDYAIVNITVEASGNLLIDKKKGPDVVNTEVPAILAKNPDKAIIAQDANGDQFVIQRKDGQTKVTKVDGGGLSPGGTNVKLKEMIIVSLKKYQKAIDDYQASNKAVQPGKGGGPSLFAWELETFLADLPECLAGSKDRLDKIESNIVSFLAPQSETFGDFESVVKNKIQERENINQDKVDVAVCQALTESPETATAAAEDKFVIIINDIAYPLLSMKDFMAMAKTGSVETEQKTIYFGYSPDVPLKINMKIAIQKKNGKVQVQNAEWNKVSNTGKEEKIMEGEQTEVPLTITESEQTITATFKYDYPTGSTWTLPLTFTLTGMAPDIYFNGANVDEKKDMVKALHQTVSVYGAGDIDLIVGVKSYDDYESKKNSDEGSEQSYNIDLGKEANVLKAINLNGTPVTSASLTDWNNYKVDITKENILEIVPSLGVSTKCKIIPKPAPAISIKRSTASNAANYGVDDYESYRQYDKKNVSASYSDVKTTVDGKDYYGPILKYNSQTQDMELYLKPILASKKLDGPLRYTIKSPTGTSEIVTIIEGYTELIGKWNLGVPKQDGEILISDMLNNVKGKIKLEKKEAGLKADYRLNVVRIKYKGKVCSAIDIETIGKQLNQAYIQINKKWEVNETVTDVELTDADIPAAGFGSVSRATALKLLGTPSIATNPERINYQVLLKELYYKVLPKKMSLNTKEYYMYALHNDMSKVLYGFAVLETKVFFISNSIPDRTVAHEVGHNLGLGEVCVDLGRCSEQDKPCIFDDVLQRNSSNIMGYSDGYDFYRWQAEIIIK